MKRTTKLRGCKLRTNRPAFTVLELIMVLAIFSFVLACASVALATLWRTQMDVQADVASVATVSQLARHLRADAHLARSAELLSSENGRPFGVSLESRDSRTDYRSENHRIVRLVQSSDKVTHREVFVLHQAISVEWSLTNSGNKRLQVSLTRHEELSHDSELETLEIETVVGILAGGRP